MKNEKSPGSDGITVEIYKTVWDDLNQYLVDSLNVSFVNGHLTDLQKQGIISLIPKSGKDLTTLSSWRPVILLNLDYNKPTKTIANGVKNVISQIINESQTGFIKDPYIWGNVRLTFELIEYVNVNNRHGLFFYSDFEKAFDSLNHEFMFKCLNYFNFGDDLMQWVKVFYHGTNSIIINKGHFAESFQIKIGVRQGCPLSSFLWNKQWTFI